MTLTLNERSYLGGIIQKYFPEIPSDDIWDLTEHITEAQRGKFLKHYFNKEHDLAKHVVENLKQYEQQAK